MMPPRGAAASLLDPLTAPGLRLRLEVIAAVMALTAILALPFMNESTVKWLMQLGHLLPGFRADLSGPLPALEHRILFDMHTFVITLLMIIAVLGFIWALALQALEQYASAKLDLSSGEWPGHRWLVLLVSLLVFISVRVLGIHVETVPIGPDLHPRIFFSLPWMFGLAQIVLPYAVVIVSYDQLRPAPEGLLEMFLWFVRFLVVVAIDLAVRWLASLYMLLAVIWGTKWLLEEFSHPIDIAHRVAEQTRSVDTALPMHLLIAVGAGLLFHLFITARLAAWTRTVVEERARAHVMTPHLVSNLMAPLANLVAQDQTKAIAVVNSIRLYASRVALTGYEKAQSWTLAEEFDALGEYAVIAKLRYPFSFQKTLPETLREASCPVLLLQPLLENVVAHGVRPRAGQGLPEVECRVAAIHEGNWCTITADMNAVPWDQPATASGGLGLGRTLVRRRVEAMGFLHKGSYKDGPTPTGWSTTIRFRLPRDR